MSATMDGRLSPAKQSDRLLWLAGAVVGTLGLAWLVLSILPASSSSDPGSAGPAPPAIEDASTAGSPAPQTPVPPSERLDNPLRMAELAYEAGMLVEPEEYSAWTLFARALADDPDNAEARAGLESVAAELLERAEVALEQGRFAAADGSVTRILDRLPEHRAALELAAEIARETAAARAVRREEQRLAARPVAAPPDDQAENVVAPVTSGADQIAGLDDAFSSAMRENRLLTPTGDNAKHYVEAMLQTDADHELTRAARELLTDELLNRSTQALEALDPDAARSWVDAAEDIAPDPAAIAEARARLSARVFEIESAKPIPASSLEILNYVAPDYPSRARRSGVEGWVDVEFTVDVTGAVHDIVIADASHERYFRDEAIDAIAQWQFAPRVFMGQTISQRSYTRIRFSLAE